MDSHFKKTPVGSFKKATAFLTAIVLIALCFSSCSKKAKTTFELLSEKTPSDSLFLIVNNPKEDVISRVEINKSLTLTDDGDRFLVIPRYQNSVIEIYTVKKVYGGYSPVERVYLNESSGENFVLDVNAVRSDDHAEFEIIVRTKDKFSEYVLKAVPGENDEQSFEYGIADNVGYSKETRFCADEIAFFSYRDGAYLKKVYGQPTNEVTFERSNGSTGTRMFFDSTVFELNNIDNHIYHAIMLDDKLPHARGIKIGESLPMVLVSFPNQNDGYTAVYEGNEAEGSMGQKEGASYTYQLLYGVFGIGQYGYIKYDSREVVTEVIYVDNDTSLIFSFKNNRVLSIEYRFDV